MMAAGAPAAVEALRPVLRRIGRDVFVIGQQPGQAQVMKLVNNMIAATNIITAYEAFALGAKAGLDPDIMLQLVNAGTGRSYVSSDIMPTVLSGRFGFGATVAVTEKDVALGLEEAAAQGVPMRTVEQAARVWRFGLAHGAEGRDIAEFARQIEAWAGTEIRSRRGE